MHRKCGLFICILFVLTASSVALNLKFRKAIATVAAFSTLSCNPSFAAVPVISDIPVKYYNEDKPIKEFLGKKATLIVNVASQCALTPQYEGLVQLKNEFKDEGFEIIGFPSNQFAGQEPGEIETIRKQTLDEYKRNFPLMDKIDVNGPTAARIYNTMKDTPDIQSAGSLKKISWNFEKFLVDANGTPVRRYRPGVLPTSVELEADVKSLVTKGTVPPRKKATLNDF